jgi:hypothetical protein
MNLRPRRGLPALVVLASLALAAAAPAATEAPVVSATDFTVPPAFNGVAGQGEATAACTGKQRATGGGVFPTDAPQSDLVEASGPLNAGETTLGTNDGDLAKYWYAAVAQPELSVTLNERVFALCTRQTDAQIQANNFTVPQAQRGDATVRCPGTQRALGGGVVESGPAANIYIQTSGPLTKSGDASTIGDGDVARRWYASVQNHTENDVLLKVFAICSVHSRAKMQVASVTVPQNQRSGGNPQCDPGEHVVGGGVVSEEPAETGMYLEGSGPARAGGFVADDGEVAIGWDASMTNFSGTTALHYKVVAICE